MQRRPPLAKPVTTLQHFFPIPVALLCLRFASLPPQTLCWCTSPTSGRLTGIFPCSHTLRRRAHALHARRLPTPHPRNAARLTPHCGPTTNSRCVIYRLPWRRYYLLTWPIPSGIPHYLPAATGPMPHMGISFELAAHLPAQHTQRFPGSPGRWVGWRRTPATNVGGVYPSRCP